VNHVLSSDVGGTQSLWKMVRPIGVGSITDSLPETVPRPPLLSDHPALITFAVTV